MKTIPQKNEATMKEIKSYCRRKAGLTTLALLLVSSGWLPAQTAYNLTTAGKYWGNSTNWNPTGIPNGTDVVAQVNLASANLNLTNTAENITASGAFPFVVGKLQIGTTASGTIGLAAGSPDERLRFATSTGVPIIDYSANVSIYSKLYSNQGLYITNSAQNNKLLEFRYNTSAMQVTGTVEIATGACLEQNGDYTLGNPTNVLQLDDGATWSTRTSLNTAGDTTPATRPIFLNCPNTPANIGTYSTYPWRIFAPIGEMAAGSSLKMPGTIAGFTTYGTGTITMAATNTFTGPMIVAGGTLNFSNQFTLQNNTLTMSGGSVTFDKGITGSAFNLGGLAGTGNLAVQNTTPAAIVLTVGANNASTTYSGNLTGAGTLVKVGTGTLDIQGAGNNTAGVLTVSNGVVLLDKASTATVHAINNGIAISGGTVQLSGTGGDQIADTKTVTINSGTFDFNGLTETIGGLAGLGGTNLDSVGSGTLTVGVPSGTAVTNASAMNGGNLVFSGPGTQVLAGTDNRDAFFSGLTTTVTGGTLQLGTGGALPAIGGAAGITLTSPGTLALNGAGTFAINLTGTGNLAVNSAGTVTLANSDTHTGTTLVNSGTLALASGATSVGGSVITIASNATLDLSGGAGALALNAGQTFNGAGAISGNYSVAAGATNAGNLTCNGNITLQAGAVLNPGSPLAAGTITNNGNLVNAGNYQLLYYLAPLSTPGGGTNSLLVVSGNLNVGSGGNAAKVVINGAPANGTYVLATFGSFSGTLADVTVAGPSGRQVYTLQTSGNQLQLVVSGQGAQNLVWRGDGSANVWDANNNGNRDWFNTGLSAAEYFGQGDYVTFDNSSINFTVNLTGTLDPQLNSVVLVNSTNNFLFTGSGALDGSVSLTKTNTGVLTLQNNNTFTGPVNLNGGVVSVETVALNGSPSPLGAGTTLAFNGGTLQYTGENANGSAFNRAVTLGASGGNFDIEGTADAAYLFVGSISGSGSLTKTGTNQLVITGNNTGYTNITYVKNGQLQLNNANALGTSTSLVFATNSGASVAVGGGVTGTIVKPLALAGAGDGNGALQAFSATTFSGAITLVTNASIGGTATDTISGLIGGAGALTKLGAGTQILTANNTYTGGTTVTAGTLQLGNGVGTNGWYGPMAAGAMLTNNGTLAFNHTNNVAVTNSITGAGWLNQLGSGVLTLGSSNYFTGGNVFGHPTIGLNFTAAVFAGAGTVLITNSYALGTVGAETQSRLQLAGNISLPVPLSVYSSGAGVTNVENLSGTNSVDAIFGIYGNSYWPITATAGQLNINNFSNVIFNSTYTRVLQLQGPANGSVTNTIDPSFYWLQIQKDGAGTWSLEGSIDAPIGLLVNSGTLIVDGSVNALLRNQTISHTVAGGTLIVNGSLPVGSTSGNVAVNGGQIGGMGSINGNVSVAAGAAVSPSARNGTNTSQLAISGNLALAGNLIFNVNKSLAQANDVVNVGGSAVNSGSGLVTLTNNGPALVVGDTFTVISQFGSPLALANGGALTINPVVRGLVGQYVTWTNNLAVDGTIKVLSVAPLGTNATLLSLALNPADNLTPTFATNVFVYYATNAFGITPTVTVTNANLTASNALVVNGVFSQVLTSGVPSLTLTNLGLGATNVLKVLVTAQDTVTTNLVTINLTQLALLVNTNSFVITNSFSAGNLNLSWPTDRKGWRLQTQTNSLGAGLSHTWYDWPNSTNLTGVSLPLNPANPTVFFRMVYP